MKKVILFIMIGVIAMLNFGCSKTDKLSDEKIISVLSEKSGVDFGNALLIEVENYNVKVDIKKESAQIKLVLSAEKSIANQILKEVEACRNQHLVIEDTMFLESWKDLISDSSEYYAYEIYNGGRKYAKCLNTTYFLMVFDSKEQNYSIYVDYLGD